MTEFKLGSLVEYETCGKYSDWVRWNETYDRGTSDKYTTAYVVKVEPDRIYTCDQNLKILSWQIDGYDSWIHARQGYVRLVRKQS